MVKTLTLLWLTSGPNPLPLSAISLLLYGNDSSLPLYSINNILSNKTLPPSRYFPYIPTAIYLSNIWPNSLSNVCQYFDSSTARTIVPLFYPHPGTSISITLQSKSLRTDNSLLLSADIIGPCCIPTDCKIPAASRTKNNLKTTQTWSSLPSTWSLPVFFYSLLSNTAVHCTRSFYLLLPRKLRTTISSSTYLIIASAFNSPLATSLSIMPTLSIACRLANRVLFHPLH